MIFEYFSHPSINFWIDSSARCEAWSLKTWVDFFDVNVAFLQGALTTKIERGFTPYTLKNQRNLSKISFNIKKRFTICSFRTFGFLMISLKLTELEGGYNNSRLKRHPVGPRN